MRTIASCYTSCLGSSHLNITIIFTCIDICTQITIDAYMILSALAFEFKLRKSWILCDNLVIIQLAKEGLDKNSINFTKD